MERTATRLARVGKDGAPGSAYLLMIAGATSSIIDLPTHGAVTIGRTQEAEIHVDHSSVSRRHAVIRIEDGSLSIADLGSHNGTQVNGEVIKSVRALATGDVVTIGDVVFVVHLFAALQPRTIEDEDGFRARLGQELARAISFGRSVGVLALLDVRARELDAAPLAVIDVLGATKDGHALVLLPEVSVEHALAVAKAMPRARIGFAACPDDACDVDTILFAARSAARAATPGTVKVARDAATRIELGERHVVVADPAMARVYALLQRIAPSEIPVLITGETGVGKENAAFAVHHWSKRTGPFIAVNCAALGPESLIDSELFGHDRGAFTGAASAKAGLFESAAGGTLFLDEIGELPNSVQSRLLRALEAKTITRLGENRERPIDVRVVTATNRVLETEVASGRFRQDLMYRLMGANVVLPPLRDRRSEIPLLAHAFLVAACARTGRNIMTIKPSAMQALVTHTWPGNVRELKHAMEYVSAAAPDDVVEPGDLPERLGGAGTPPLAAPSSVRIEPAVAATFRPIADEIRELERRRMVEALAAADGVKTRAAQLIDMPIRTFTLKAKQYGL
ncbi:MAG: sigma 54-interacting transcriptional regulator [Kofleriaceae bacterium]